MLTPPTLKKLRSEQQKLDNFIVKTKNLTDTNSKKSFIRTKIALLVEIGELANELKTFKHWKNQKDID
jgi:dimeric dUTPase (all-alpha-NTP-PPase superfamily)